MNQCVPSWDLDDPAVVAGGGSGINHPVPAAGAAHRVAVSAAGTTGGAFAPFAVPMSDQYYEVAELTWEKGNISSHGLLNRPAPSKDAPAAPPQQLQGIGGAVARTGADALVPCGARVVDESQEGGDAADASRRKRARVVGEGGGLVCASQGSAAPGHRGGSALLTLDGGCDTGADDLYGFTTTTNNSTSLDRGDKGSPDTENTSIGGGASDSRCFSRRSQQASSCRT